jgi:hypothetical protein
MHHEILRHLLTVEIDVPTKTAEAPNTAGLPTIGQGRVATTLGQRTAPRAGSLGRDKLANVDALPQPTNLFRKYNDVVRRQSANRYDHRARCAEFLRPIDCLSKARRVAQHLTLSSVHRPMAGLAKDGIKLLVRPTVE